MKWVVILVALGLTACVSDPKNGANSSDVTICVIAVCNQNHQMGKGDGNQQKSEAETDISVPVPAPL